MDLVFTVLVLEFSGTEHPRAYGIQPEISPLTCPAHPHLRNDRPIVLSGRRIPALCVYSGAVFRYGGTVPRIVEFLDQLTTFLARHIIWYRTRRLFEVTPSGEVRLHYAPRPGELIMDSEPRFHSHPLFRIRAEPVRFWKGYWPGTQAPQGSREHLRTIAPADECWCWSGRPYGECHRPLDEDLSSKLRSALSA